MGVFLGFSKRQWGILLAMTTTLTILLIDSHAIPVVLPTIQKYFLMSETKTAWIMNAHYLGIAAMIMIGGRIADIFGGRNTFLISSMLYLISSIAVSFSPMAMILLLARGAQGLSMAFMIPSALSTLMHTFDLSKRGRAWGLSVSISSLILLVAPVLVGWIVQVVNWRCVFFLNPFLALLGFFLALILLPKDSPISSKKEVGVKLSGKIDYVGALYLFLALFVGIVALMKLRQWGFLSFEFWISILLVSVLLRAVILTSKEKDSRIVDCNLFKNRKFVRCLGVVFIAQLMMPLPIYWIQYMQVGLGFSPFYTGQVAGYAMMPVFLIAPFAGYLSDHYFPKLPAFLGFICIMLGIIAFSYFMYDERVILLYAAFMLHSVGSVFILTPAGSATLSHPSPESKGGAAGVYNTIRFLGVSTGIAFFAYLHSFTDNVAGKSTLILRSAISFDHMYIFFIASIGAFLTLVHLKSYKEISTRV